jgi:hypothetical protein
LETNESESPKQAKTLTPEVAKREFEKLTHQQIGKLRSQYFTVRLGTVKACGHKFHPTDAPDTNCADCWEAYFRVHEGVVQGIESILATFGEVALVKSHGSKYTKRYKQFAAQMHEERIARMNPTGINEPGFSAIP